MRAGRLRRGGRAHAAASLWDARHEAGANEVFDVLADLQVRDCSSACIVTQAGMCLYVRMLIYHVHDTCLTALAVACSMHLNPHICMTTVLFYQPFAMGSVTCASLVCASLIL